MLILITGPAKSGKSEWAEILAAKSSQQVIYIATGTIDTEDTEWQARIDQHQQRRPSDWLTLEIPIELTTTIRYATDRDCLLIDSLGTWVANLLEASDQQWEEIVQDFCISLQETPATAILVAEETGWGVIPAYPSGRAFRDRLGSLVRQVGAIANDIYLVTAGRAINLNQISTSLE
ncbi:bifunctional adenosylcobinamide kinase/adenosylcobinamide-phosphate guanylyltransferase [Merismopedia glauca]|uniref:Adenosylcobinamide kinase n=1 Tax=Merismopedia glauca CCAP 1448/3 TaxID=1296344 RepID=A0A2T1BZ13_9CYAN|nr:bifunctional adenosylcobinamide kinase/adenosylcobinamide-phosphate guanylyltransferase [Merismopedia glauca]PSB01276.1 bifunctional adenosylcobinamide kinase/adenosylcobinamide-phosphate guanylyltransferase [Merismopedia glauca CCAP 1448/3]